MSPERLLDESGGHPALDLTGTTLYAGRMQLLLTTKIEIPESAMEDVLTTAVEGGIAYWAEGQGCKRREDLTVWEIIVWDREDHTEEFVLNADAMLTGVQRLHEEVTAGTIPAGSEIATSLRHHLFSEEDGLEYADATLADAIVQMACFREVRFG